MKNVDENVDKIIMLGKTHSGKTSRGLAHVDLHGGLEFLMTMQSSGKQLSVV